MNKFLLVFFTVFSVVQGFSQDDYTIELSGSVGRGDNCGSGGDGMQTITLIFENGSRRIIHSASGFHNTDFNFVETFSQTNTVTGIEVFSNGRNEIGGSLGGLECRTNEARITLNVSSPCFYRYYFRDDFLTGRIRSGNMTVNIYPNVAVAYDDDSSISEIYTACLSDEVNISVNRRNLTSAVYNWEFWNMERLEEQAHPEVIRLREIYDNYAEMYDDCVRENGAEGCPFLRQFMDDAFDDWNNYLQDPTTPNTIWVNVPGWSPIENKTGQSQIDLRFSDMYPRAIWQRRYLGQTIQVRLNPGCRMRNGISNVLNLSYLPDTPSITSDPVVTPPSCSYDEFSSISVPFGDGIARNQKISISLRRLNEDTQPIANSEIEYTQVFNNLVNDRYSVEYRNVVNVRNANLSSRRYEWNLPISSDRAALIAGHYALIVTSYEFSDTDNEFPTCVPRYYFFEVEAPPALVWEVTEENDQRCYGVNDGSIQLNVTSGNGPYRYSLDGGGYQTMSGSSVTITNLSPGDHTIRVIDANGCQSVQYTNGIYTAAISAVPAPITHNVPTDRIQNPTRPGEADGSIEVTSVNGGRPLPSSQPRPTIDGYEFTLYRNGNVVSDYESEITNGNFLLTNLRAGSYEISYVIPYPNDYNCEQTLFLAELVDPAPINFTLQITPATCDTSLDGRIAVTNVSGAPGPYSYQWLQNDIPLTGETSSVLTRGTGSGYSVEISSPTGFGERDNIAIGVLPPVTITNVTIPDLLCYDGTTTATVTATGGSGSYEYRILNGGSTVWQTSNQFTLPYSATGYRFEVRDAAASSCSSELSAVYTPARPQELYINDAVIVGNNVFGGSIGSIALEIVGGTPYTTGEAYQVSWTYNGSPITQTGSTITQLAAGTYQATVTDSQGCSSSSGLYEVTEPDELLVSIAETVAIACHSELATLTANVSGGSQSYTYRWYNQGTELVGELSNTLASVSPGSYTVIVNDRFTTAENTYVVTQPDVLTLSLTKTDANCYAADDGTITLNIEGGTAPYFYSLDGSTYTPVSDLS
ncbi:SprB repeat-containing protein, partial [Aquimarina brevivitae]